MSRNEAELKPKFLDLIENGWAGEGNPHKVGIFIRKGHRSGRMNPGKYFVLTDGKGDFWELTADNEKLTIIGNYADRQSLLARDAELAGVDQNAPYFYQIGKPMTVKDRRAMLTAQLDTSEKGEN